MKVYVYYIENDMYAFTINKQYKSDFEYQRNTKCFSICTLRMSENMYKAFMYKHRNHMLIEIPLSDETEDYFNVIGTQYEETMLDVGISDLDNEFSDIVKYLSNIPLKDKYMSAIHSVSVVSELKKIHSTNTLSPIEYEHRSKVNILRLFYKLFSSTFEHVNE